MPIGPAVFPTRTATRLNKRAESACRPPRRRTIRFVASRGVAVSIGESSISLPKPAWQVGPPGSAGWWRVGGGLDQRDRPARASGGQGLGAPGADSQDDQGCPALVAGYDP